VTGFNPTNAGPVKYQRYAPTEANRATQVNAPLTQKEADRLARIFGFDKDKAFTKKQYAAYLAGKGKPAGYTQAEAAKAAQLTRLSVGYLTNTTGNTYTRIIDGEEVTVNLGSTVSSSARMACSGSRPTARTRHLLILRLLPWCARSTGCSRRMRSATTPT
jgi:hypothetical protein